MIPSIDGKKRNEKNVAKCTGVKVKGGSAGHGPWGGKGFHPRKDAEKVAVVVKVDHMRETMMRENARCFWLL